MGEKSQEICVMDVFAVRIFVPSSEEESKIAVIQNEKLKCQDFSGLIDEKIQLIQIL